MHSLAHVVERRNSEFECGVCCGFRMNVREMHTNAMERQITEAVKNRKYLKTIDEQKKWNDVNRPLGRQNIECSLQ